jgi:hypothetical protein
VEGIFYRVPAGIVWRGRAIPKGKEDPKSVKNVNFRACCWILSA